MSPTSMSVDEHERILADAHIGVLSVVPPWETTPLVTPVWPTYHPAGPTLVDDLGDGLARWPR